MIRKTLSAFAEDHCMLLSAALAFYTALSFAPALILTVWGGSLLGAGNRAQVVALISELAGDSAGDVARIVLEDAGNRPVLGDQAGLIAFLGLAFSAPRVFTQAQQALNQVWNVRRRSGLGVVAGLLHKRALGFLMLILVEGLLVTAVLTSTILLSLAGGPVAPASDGRAWQAINALTSAVVFTLTVAAIFKFLPDVIIGWRSVWVGAALTGVLLVAGKFLTGLYLSRAALGSSYGAGGALFVLLVWVYYSWAIVLLGAEFTQVWARAHGHEIRPDKRAVEIGRLPGDRLPTR